MLNVHKVTIIIPPQSGMQGKYPAVIPVIIIIIIITFKYTV